MGDGHMRDRTTHLRVPYSSAFRVPLNCPSLPIMWQPFGLGQTMLGLVATLIYLPIEYKRRRWHFSEHREPGNRLVWRGDIGYADWVRELQCDDFLCTFCL